MKYGIFNDHIIFIDNENIIQKITNLDETEEYKRIRYARKKYICEKKLPDSYNNNLYNSIEILKKANNLYDYSKDLEMCGLYTTYYHNGNLKQKFFHNKGIKEGIYYEYNADSTIKLECFYVNNILHGSYTKYYSNGNIELKCNYMNGKLHGEYIYYPQTADMTVYKKFLYVDDSKEGECFYKLSNSICTGYCEKNVIIKLIEKDNLTNNILSQRYLDTENPDLIVIEINYASGKLKQKYTITKDDNKNGKYTIYYEDGNINLINYYYNNIEIPGKRTEYYANGNIKFISEYDEKNNILNKKKYYCNNQLNEISSYKNNNILLLRQKYNPDGLLIEYLNYTINNSCTHDEDIKYIINLKNINKDEIKKFAIKLLESLD